MDYIKDLFKFGDLYNHEETDPLFIRAVKKNINFHRMHCKEYSKILNANNYNPKDIRKISDLYKIPPIPTLYLKKHTMKSIADKKMLIKATSSGTKGKKSHIGFDGKALYYGFHMVMATAGYHKLLSPKPTNYIMLGYEPNKSNHTVVSKTALGATFFAPALKREYALKYIKGEYRLDIKGLKKALLSYSRQPLPVRLIGFPAYMYYFLLELKKRWDFFKTA